jgi:hypothetical protein
MSALAKRHQSITRWADEFFHYTRNTSVAAVGPAAGHFGPGGRKYTRILRERSDPPELHFKRILAKTVVCSAAQLIGAAADFNPPGVLAHRVQFST